MLTTWTRRRGGVRSAEPIAQLTSGGMDEGNTGERETGDEGPDRVYMAAISGVPACHPR